MLSAHPVKSRSGYRNRHRVTVEVPRSGTGSARRTSRPTGDEPAQDQPVGGRRRPGGGAGRPTGGAKPRDPRRRRARRRRARSRGRRCGGAWLRCACPMSSAPPGEPPESRTTHRRTKGRRTQHRSGAVPGASMGRSARRAQPAASSRARAKTASSMGSVSFPVKVFCWLTWYEHRIVRRSSTGTSTPWPNRGFGRTPSSRARRVVADLAEHDDHPHVPSSSAISRSK